MACPRKVRWRTEKGTAKGWMRVAVLECLRAAQRVAGRTSRRIESLRRVSRWIPGDTGNSSTAQHPAALVDGEGMTKGEELRYLQFRSGPEAGSGDAEAKLMSGCRERHDIDPCRKFFCGCRRTVEVDRFGRVLGLLTSCDCGKRLCSCLAAWGV